MIHLEINSKNKNMKTKVVDNCIKTRCTNFQQQQNSLEVLEKSHF